MLIAPADANQCDPDDFCLEVTMTTLDLKKNSLLLSRKKKTNAKKNQTENQPIKKAQTCLFLSGLPDAAHLVPRRYRAGPGRSLTAESCLALR